MALVISDRAVERPEEIALRDGRVELLWSQLNELLDRATNALLGMDLPEPRRVSVFAENAAETAIAHLGGLYAGCSTVPVNFHLTAEEVAFILTDSKTTVLFVGPENLERGVEAARSAGVDTVIAWRCSPTPGVISWEQWLADASPAAPPTSQSPRPNLMYTSGTTGVPKGVDLPPTMFAGGSDIAQHIEALKANRFAQLGTHLVVGPMYHTGPLSGLRVLAAGVPVVVLGRFDPEAVLDAIQRHRTTSSVMVPTHFTRLLSLSDEIRERYDVSSMQLIAHTGAACPIDVKHRMISWFGPILSDAYGATEVGTICSITSEEWLEHPGSVGRTVPPFTRAIVVDDDGNELAPGHEGKLYFEDSTGRGIVYPSDPDKTAKAHLRPGVFTIGEIGYVDPDGYVYLTDRFSDMIVSGGVNIYPAEAEQVMIAHPKVSDVAVIGVPDPDMGEAVKALVVPVDATDPPSGAELIALCREHLSGYKCPRTVDIVTTVGRNAMGKVNKRALRAPYWQASKHGG
jgi:long-chain acyl-CoA synthetase